MEHQNISTETICHKCHAKVDVGRWSESSNHWGDWKTSVEGVRYHVGGVSVHHWGTCTTCGAPIMRDEDPLPDQGDTDPNHQDDDESILDRTETYLDYRVQIWWRDQPVHIIIDSDEE